MILSAIPYNPFGLEARRFFFVNLFNITSPNQTYMRLRYLIIVFAFMITGCSQTSSKEQKENTTTTGSSSSSAEVKDGSDGFWQKLEMHELKDQNGVVTAVMPFPASWKLMPAASSADPVIVGPNSIKVFSFPGKNFMQNYNPQLQYAYAQTQQREMPGVERLIQEDFVPVANSQGMQFVKYYEIPEISKVDKWFSDQLFKALPARSEIAAFGIEWTKSDGSPYFTLLHLNVATSQAMQTWYYSLAALEADADHFETAKKQWIFGLSNMRHNLEPIMAYNREEAQRCGQSWAAHNRRMAQNQANFEASQRDFVNRSNAAHDALMSGWRERNASMDRQQEQTMDRIYERTNVQDPTTGQQYKVAAGANQYWMNSNGEYISTKLNDYDPNLDKNMNEQRWQQLKEIKK